jgi:hypothetical protein
MLVGEPAQDLLLGGEAVGLKIDRGAAEIEGDAHRGSPHRKPCRLEGTSAGVATPTASKSAT